MCFVKRLNLLYFIIIFSVVLIAQNFLVFRAVNEMNGDARVVNYAGLVRGATQRLVKLEMSGAPNDVLIEKLDKYIDGLSGIKNEYNITYMNDVVFQSTLKDLADVWGSLKDCIYKYRKGEVSHQELLKISEIHFKKADEAVQKAEISSEKKLKNIKDLIVGGRVVIGIILVIVVILLHHLKRLEKKQYDILKEKNEQLELAIEEADKASKAKSTFLANMSHDIRTPLNGIMGMTTIAIANIHNNEKVRDCLKNITRSSKHLLSLINDILDMSKIESGKLELNNDDFYLPEFMENLIGIIQQLVQNKQQSLSVSMSNVEHEYLIGDVLRINQVLINILSNAVKFTPAGGKISIHLNELPSNREEYARLRFICTDNGMGMSEEFKNRIFETFSRETDLKIDKIEGTGLGMTITKNIIDLMNGEIEVESSKGKGSTFVVTLDFQIKENAKEQWEYETLKGMKILVVDDDKNASENAVYELNDLGMIAECVYPGAVAIQKFVDAKKTGNEYKAVILDWKMPDMSGLELAKAIRKHSSNIPIIITSAYDWAEIQEEAKSAGITGYVSKPLFKSSLYHKIKQLSQDVGHDFKEQEKETSTFDFTNRRILLVEDNVLNTEIAKELLSFTGAVIDCAFDGQAGVEKFIHSEEYYYDIILMDIQMPVLDGYEATKQIRKIENRGDALTVPIIAMTANAFAEDIREAKAAGMNEHIAKPLDFEMLKAIMQKWLKDLPRVSTSKNNSEVFQINIEAGIQRLMGNKALYERCLKKFPNDKSFNELVDAITASNCEEASKAAHTLKGVSGNLALDELYHAVVKIMSELRTNNLEDAKITLEEVKKEYNAVIEYINQNYLG